MFFFLSFTVHYQFFGLDEDCCCHGKACGPFLLCMGSKRADHLTFQGGGGGGEGFGLGKKIPPKPLELDSFPDIHLIYL